MNKFEYISEEAEKINQEFINKVNSLTKKEKCIKLLIGIDNERFFLRGNNKETAPSIINTITSRKEVMFVCSVKKALEIDRYIKDTAYGLLRDIPRDDSEAIENIKQVLLDVKIKAARKYRLKIYEIVSESINGFVCHFVNIKLNKKIYKRLKNSNIVDMFSNKMYTYDHRGVENVIHAKNIFNINTIVLLNK